MALNPDFRDLFAAFSATASRFLVVGGYAVAFHAAPRFTKDLDIWIEATPENAGRVFESLTAFGAPTGNLTREDLAREGLVFQIGLPPNRIDVLTSITGVSFSEAWDNRVESRYGDQPIWILSRRLLITNKRSMGRPQDLIDADLLERFRG